MLHFTKLRLNGFKSFAETTELDILPGLTGIVGPNGCGKSNLTEALRWLMGETSAKSLRGGGMEDVIFAGTGKRPSRNFSEVVLTLGNPNKTAPDPYRNLDTIEVSRRIDRGMGSDYRINGKLVRAADVQLLFADSATGANSPSIVSQGRVTHLIQAKPVDRRRVLEDAAAISGLHTRRKEAETRLRAAEKNLQRVDDLLGQKTVLYEQLVKQAKQAERYRSLSDMIHRLEALGMAMEWTRVQNDLEAAQSAMVVANEAQNQAKVGMYELSKRRENLAEQWNAIERQLAELQQKTQAVQRQKDRAEEELNRYERTRTDLDQQQEIVVNDIAYETEAQTAAEERMKALQTEQTDLQTKLGDFTALVETARNERETARSAYDHAQQTVAQARSEWASVNAKRQMLSQQLQRLVQDKNTLHAEAERTQAVLNQLALDLQASDLENAERRMHQLDHNLQAALDHLTQLEKQSETSVVTTKAAYDSFQTAQSGLNRIDTEIKALASLAEAPNKSQNFDAVLDQVTAENGFEQALTVALGRELRAGLSDSAPTYWSVSSVPALPALPPQATALTQHVTAPESLAAALAMVGVVADRQAGDACVGALQPGQMLVSRDGYGWRWDGFRITPAAQSSAQERETKQLLEQRNRLKQLRAEREAVAIDAAATQQAYQTAQGEQQAVQQQTTQTRQHVAQIQRDLGQARHYLAQVQQKQADIQARQNALAEKQSDLNTRTIAAEQAIAAMTAEIAALPAENDGQEKLAALQAESQQAETAYREKDHAFVGMNAQQTQWQQRLHVIARDLVDGQQRLHGATQRLEALQQRHTALAKALSELASPDHARQQIEQAEQELKNLETSHFAIQTARSDINTTRQKIEQENSELQESLMGARETLVRAETQFQNGQALQQQLIERCEQHFGCTPDGVGEQFHFSDDELAQNLQTMRAKQDRARNERERIGAVNLRAEEESQTLGVEIETLTKEKDDILAAIERLRQGIATLNRDARKKMLAAFEEVNERFKETFTRLFNGGEAYLQLIDAEDPLEAGLEIFAQPPGKRLQTLTLLSGGEQSLTAIALVFAMFLTQPSPICILDEIDAALDDANVERICSLLQDFAKTHPTRFLVITHNPITMAHLHRLYGVTMVEKGVSKLVSVDLEKMQQPELAMAAE